MRLNLKNMGFFIFAFCLCLGVVNIAAARAGAPPSLGDLAAALAPHKAAYDIRLISTHSGSQIINISGKMVYETRLNCGAWLTDHHFKLNYEYADMPGMRITSDFSTHESLDGQDFNFSSRRFRDGTLYQELRGHGQVDEHKGGRAVYTTPEGISFDLSQGTVFPMTHTLRLLQHAQAQERFYDATIFDGSDEDGPIEIKTFIGAKSDEKISVMADKPIDKNLLKTPHWTMRMAVFPLKNKADVSDYEMTLVFHQNGVISDMVIDYDDFSVRQRLISLESLPQDSCAAPSAKKP